jgi:hypothetical protein
VVVAAPADISLVGGADKALQLRLVRCTENRCGPDWLDWVVPSRGRPSEFVVQVANAAQSPALITGIEIALRGDPGRPPVPQDAFLPTATTATLGPQAVSLLPPITVNREGLEPGHYVGAIYLSIEGGEKRTALPFEVDVKDGPFWALLVLILAVAIQFVVMIANGLKLRGAELRQWRKVRRRYGLLDAEDQKLLTERVENTGRLALHGDLQDAKEAREAVDKDIGRLANARRLERLALDKRPGLTDEIRTKLTNIRRDISDGAGAAADAKLTELQKAVDELSPVEHERNLSEIFKTRKNVMLHWGALLSAGDGQAVSSVAGIWAFIIWIWRHLLLVLGPIVGPIWRALRTATRVIGDAFVIFWIAVMPWLLRVLLVVLFVLAGLKELYYDNATFGVEPVLNYGALLIWGVSATVVNTALGKVIPGQG